MSNAQKLLGEDTDVICFGARKKEPCLLKVVDAHQALKKVVRNHSRALVEGTKSPAPMPEASSSHSGDLPWLSALC